MTRVLVACIFFGLRLRKNPLVRLQTVVWRLLCAKIGKWSVLSGCSMTWPHKVQIGKYYTIEQGVQFKDDGIWTPGAAIIVGSHSFLGTGVEFNIRSRITIGEHALIASGCRFVDGTHGFTRRDIPMRCQQGKEASINIEGDVWIGANAVILKGVTIGRGAIIGAGAVVNKPVPAYEIWAGVPARKIGERP